MQLSPDQSTQLPTVARAIGAVCIVVYGSQARGDGRPDSDLDIAVLSHQKPDYDLFTKAFSLLSDVFRGRNVDVRFLNDADPLFTMQVVRDGILLFGDQDSYDDLKMLANRRYIDDGAKYFPQFEIHIQEQQQRLEAMIL